LAGFAADARRKGKSSLDGKELLLGSAEIEIKDPSGQLYVVPDLIYHYITEHQYLPPPEFVRAVCSRSDSGR